MPETIPTKHEDLLAVCDATYAAFMRAAGSNHPSVSYTRFRNSPPTGYSILQTALKRLLRLLCDNSPARASLIYDMCINNGESVSANYARAEAVNFNARRIF